MRKFQVDRFTNFARYLRVSYSRNPVPNVFEQDAIDKKDPAQYQIMHKLESQPRNRLMWSFNANTSRTKLPLAVMRNRLKRRWSEAFRQALLQRGYEYDGRRVTYESREVRSAGLQGTLQVLILEAGGWEEDMDWLVGLAGGLVDSLEKNRFGSSGSFKDKRKSLG